MQIRCVNYCNRTGAPIVDSISVNEGYNLYHVFLLSASWYVLFFFDTLHFRLR